MTDSYIDRIKKLRVAKSGEVWELAESLLPANVSPHEGAEPEAMVAFICAGNKGGVMMADPQTTSTYTIECWSQALGKFALEPLVPKAKPLNYLPAKVVLGPELAGDFELIAATLRPLGVVVEVGQSTPNADEALASLAKFLSGKLQGSDGNGDGNKGGESGDERDDASDHGASNKRRRGESRLATAQGLASINKMTAERIASFARAAALFFAAQPWRYPSREMLWQITPEPQEQSQRYCLIMGGGGNEFGIAFLSSPEQMAQMAVGGTDMFDGNRSLVYWSIMFNAADETPKADVFWWQKHRLPLAEPDCYPVAVGMKSGPEVIRPTAEGLTFFESLLRVFAELTEDEVTTGKIVREVSVFGGPRTMTLTAMNP